MSENKHTPEPYAYMTLESQWRLGNGGNIKGAVPIHKRKSSTAKIPLYEQSTIDEVIKQRDELLAALEDLYLEFERTREWGCLPMAMVKARAAISSVKGGAR